MYALDPFIISAAILPVHCDSAFNEHIGCVHHWLLHHNVLPASLEWLQSVSVCHHLFVIKHGVTICCSAWKCMLGESYDRLTQGRVMSYMQLAWGLGCIAGPAIGGVLSQPCNTRKGLLGCGTASEPGFLQLR